VKTLIICMRNPKERLPAAIAILDRAWGKPKQVIEAEGGVGVNVALLIGHGTQDAPHRAESCTQGASHGAKSCAQGTPRIA
jgi:hypothetical protein